MRDEEKRLEALVERERHPANQDSIERYEAPGSPIIADGEQWFMALQTRNIPTELVRYPRSSHGLSRTGEPWLLVDRLERIRSWFMHWLGDDQ